MGNPWDDFREYVEDRTGVRVETGNTFADVFTLGWTKFDINDPFGTKKAAEQQQQTINQYQAQQEALMRDEQNRQWQTEISNSWAAYGAQRRSQAAMGGLDGAAKLGASTATDLYLGGR